jgi:hypothetical protein
MTMKGCGKYGHLSTMIDRVSLMLQVREIVCEKMNTGRNMKYMLSKMNLIVPL